MENFVREYSNYAQVKKLLIGHYSARYIDLLPLEKEARSIFHNTLLANEGMVLSL